MYKNCFKILIGGLLSICLINCSTNTSDDWEVLFNGQNLEGWQRVAGTGEYAIEDSAIVGTAVIGSPNTFLITEKEYGDFILELEVKLEDTLINSGIQFRSQYDPNGKNGKGLVYGYQFELDPSSRGWTGGIYDESRRGWLYPLSLNPAAQKAFKVNEFNKVRIECVGSRIVTWVNDQPASILYDTVDAKGVIALQVHSIGDSALAGKKIYWKNIRIKTSNIDPVPLPEEAAKSVYVVNFLKNELSKEEEAQGYKLLFNGKNSDGWVGAYKENFPEKGWEITEDGILKVLKSDGAESTNGGDIVTKAQYSSFDLSFEYMLTPGANSGVKYFVTLSEGNTGSAIGLEYQLLDDQLHPDAKLGKDGNRTMASLYDLITAKKQDRFVNKPGSWNRGRIVVKGNEVSHYLNGIKVVEYTRGSEEFREIVAGSKYKGWKDFGEAPKGHILLQDHGDEVHFKNIKIKEIAD